MFEYPEYWIWTIQMSRWRLARDLNIPFIDITVKSGIKEFAPSWDDLLAYKRKELDNEEYLERYILNVVRHTGNKPSLWDDLLVNKNIALACYCRAGQFCHRYCFASILTHVIQSRGKTVEYKGELIEHPNNAIYYNKKLLDKMNKE